MSWFLSFVLSLVQPATYGIVQLQEVLNSWGQPDNSGVVDIDDLLFVINNWNQPVSIYPFIVSAPIEPTSEVPYSDTWGFVLDGQNDKVLNDLVTIGTTDGLLLNNGKRNQSARVETHNFTGLGIKAYGFYLSHPVDHLHDGFTLVQAKGANQACIRVGGGDHLVLQDFVLDNHTAKNDSIRIYGCDEWAVVDADIHGGVFNVGWAASQQYPLTHGWIFGGTFHYDQPAGPHYPAAINVRYWVGSLVIQGLAVEGGSRFLDSDTATSVTLIDCTYNGEPVTLSDIGGNKTNVEIIP